MKLVIATALLITSTLAHGYARCGLNEIRIPGGGCDCDYRNGFARLDGVNCLKCPVNGHWEAA